MFSKDTWHLWILAAGLLCVGLGYATVRTIMVPATFGQDGHYRSAALDEELARERKLVSASECWTCHEEQKAEFSESAHKEVHCFNCHDNLLEHFNLCTKAVAEAKAAGKDAKSAKCGPEGMKLDNLKPACVRCHTTLTGRPAEFTVVNQNEHLEEMEAEEPKSARVCLECHLGHKPSEEPDDEEEDEEDEDEEDEDEDDEADEAAAATPVNAATGTDNSDEEE